MSGANFAGESSHLKIFVKKITKNCLNIKIQLLRDGEH